MNSVKTYLVVDPQILRLDERLKELPYNAKRRLSAELIGIDPNRYQNILLKLIKKITQQEINAFCKFFKCTKDQFLDPNYLFEDFRTQEEIEEDLKLTEKVNG